MNSRAKKALLGLTAISVAVPLIAAPLPSAFPRSTAYAASNEAPASMDDPLRAQLLHEIKLFQKAVSHMTSPDGSLKYEYVLYTDRIVSETSSIARSETSTPKRLERALKYIRFSYDDYLEKGRPSIWLILIHMQTYLYMHFKASDEPGGYSQEKVNALIAEVEQYQVRVDAGEDRTLLFKQFIETMVEFYDHPNP